MYVTHAAGDRFLILASDGLLERLSPGEVCAIAAAVAAGQPHHIKYPKPAAIALGPSDGDGSSAAGRLPPSQPQPPASAMQQADGARCSARPGIVACSDCCSEQESDLRLRPHLPQAIAVALQEAAYNCTALDNIAVIVIPLKRCDLVPQSCCTVPLPCKSQFGGC